MTTPRYLHHWSFSLLMALVAMAHSTVVAYRLAPTDPKKLEIDGWAVKIGQFAPERIPVDEIFTTPSLWKGPIVPTVYYVSYFVWPSQYCVLGCNILAFGIAVGLLHRLFSKYGHPVAATLAMLAWIVAPYNRILFTYYFAEPLIGVLSTCVLCLLVNSPKRAFVIGAAMGILLLARPPFLLVAGSVPILAWMIHTGSHRERLGWSARYTVGLMCTFLPWAIRNMVLLGAFVPFTVEGGQTLFHGSYLPVEEDRWQVLKELPDVQPLVTAAPDDPVDRMNYFSALAKKQVLADPLGQGVRCIRKGLKFWMRLTPGSWVPEAKTCLAATGLLALAAWTTIRNRRRPLFFWSAVWILGLWAMHAIVFGIMRYNFPVQPMLFFLAASAFWPPRESDSTNLAQGGITTA